MANAMAAAPHIRARARVRWLFAALLLVGCIGLVLRFIGFPTRLFWTDEGVTAMRISGHTGAQITANLVDNRVHSVADLLRYAGRGSQGSIRDVGGFARARGCATSPGLLPARRRLDAAVWALDRFTSLFVGTHRLPRSPSRRMAVFRVVRYEPCRCVWIRAIRCFAGSRDLFAAGSRIRAMGRVRCIVNGDLTARITSPRFYVVVRVWCMHHSGHVYRSALTYRSGLARRLCSCFLQR